MTIKYEEYRAMCRFLAQFTFEEAHQYQSRYSAPPGYMLVCCDIGVRTRDDNFLLRKLFSWDIYSEEQQDWMSSKSVFLSPREASDSAWNDYYEMHPEIERHAIQQGADTDQQLPAV